MAGFTQEGLPVITARGDGNALDVRIGPDYRRNGKKAASPGRHVRSDSQRPRCAPRPLAHIPPVDLFAGRYEFVTPTASKGRRFRTTSPRASPPPPEGVGAPNDLCGLPRRIILNMIFPNEAPALVGSKYDGHCVQARQRTRA